ncbi:MAG TPA: Mur ligase family protein [Thermoanaerobaculia bacterium]|jgi:UDP-N-acetylmuramyl tripeptide synthase|nr:Mur ligase family protein [Thermoanaerobaculia bacterium]
MKLLDSRRLTGPNLLLDRAGAVLEVSLAPEEAEAAVTAWRENVRPMLGAVGWPNEEIAVRRFPGGASLAISAPIDSLYPATEVNEWAWAAAEAAVKGAAAPDLAEAAEGLRAMIAREANPSLLALRAAAAAHGVSFLWDDRHASVGLGTGSLTWPAEALPHPATVDWSAAHDVPVLMVTGTNGKTTTVRLLGAIAAAAGKVPGLTSTDHVEVGGEVVDRGDFSGPGGARILLRDRRVEIAILETARGGMLRRGLAVTGADAALVTNIAADHLGELGVFDLPGLAEAKLVIAQAVKPGGRIVLNADDPELLAMAGRLVRLITWFSLDPASPRIRSHLTAEGDACFLEDGVLVLARGSERTAVIRVEEIPLTLGGAARHNVANALGAIGLAAAAGLPVAAIAEGLRSLTGNLGRAVSMELGGVHLLLDYAHNPHGMAALVDLADRLPGNRRLLVLGQAGDRDDEAIRELARAAWPLRPDRIVVKELPEMLRGRGPGEVPAVLRDELLRLGAAPGSIAISGTELEGIRDALAWAWPGDLLVLLAHTQRDEVLALLDRLRETGWRAGEPVPN